MTPLDLLFRYRVGDVEASVAYDHISFPEDLTASAVGGDDPSMRDPVDAVGDQFGLRVATTREVAVKFGDPFAADAYRGVACRNSRDPSPIDEYCICRPR